jgi:hypothetical protein
VETNRCPPFESRQLVLSIYDLTISSLSLLYKSAKMKVKFFGEMTKARLDVDPVVGQEVERIINDAVELDAALLGKLKDIFYK